MDFRILDRMPPKMPYELGSDKPMSPADYAMTMQGMRSELCLDVKDLVLRGIPQEGPLTRTQVTTLLERAELLLFVGLSRNSDAREVAYVQCCLGKLASDSSGDDFNKFFSSCVDNLVLTRNETVETICSMLLQNGNLREEKV